VLWHRHRVFLCATVRSSSLQLAFLIKKPGRSDQSTAVAVEYLYSACIHMHPRSFSLICPPRSKNGGTGHLKPTRLRSVVAGFHNWRARSRRVDRWCVNFLAVCCFVLTALQVQVCMRRCKELLELETRTDLQLSTTQAASYCADSYVKIAFKLPTRTDRCWGGQVHSPCAVT